MIRGVLLLLVATTEAGAQLPIVVVESDDTAIHESCEVRIPEGLVIADTNGDGVIHIVGDGITVAFHPGSELRGAEPGRAPEDLRGTAVRIEGRRDVRITGLRVRGFRQGIHAQAAPGLVVDGADFAGMGRVRLRSTPAGEDAADWLRPHRNDGGEWRRNYPSAVCVEQSPGILLRGVRVREAQNGIILDRVQDGAIVDCDASFLSGWGLALWRSSRNTIHRNAFDFCVRGYSHGVYNRGQDSAGLLLFEQCSENHVVENSMTHGGDGVFAFAGEEALAGTAPRGCNENLFRGNDLSYAAAHGLEITFSFGNLILENRFAGNAICGIWGGYSQRTIVARNRFEGNGEAGYGEERGGINIEHGFANVLVDNGFARNAVGIRLWEDEDPGLRTLPWVLTHHRGSSGNIVARNHFARDRIAVQLRRCTSTVLVANRFESAGTELDADAPSRSGLSDEAGEIAMPPHEGRTVPARTQPIGARATLSGRASIVMTEYGPWDHERPLARRRAGPAEPLVYELLGFPPDTRATVLPDRSSPGLEARIAPGEPPELRIDAEHAHWIEYAVRVHGDRADTVVSGAVLRVPWTIRVFPCLADPREDAAAFAAASRGPGAITVQRQALDLRFGSGGAGPLFPEAESARNLPPDCFGTVAEAEPRLPPGRWRVRTLSDDGVRVVVDGRTVIENWTHHGPTHDQGAFATRGGGPVRIRVEHFELDGHAVLALELDRVEGGPR
jgi:hypothetical protein